MSCDTLGCPERYDVYVADRGGRTLLTAESLPVSELRWGRVLDGQSSATATIETSEAPECCGILAELRTWRHELVIYRDEERVWEGPITAIVGGRNSVVITARDVSIWLARRVIHGRRCFSTECGGAPADLSRIAEILVRDGLGADDPNVLPYLVVNPSGFVGERDYQPATGYTLDELNELARTSIDYTTLGRAIIIGGPLTFGTISQLRCDDFLGDVATVEDGMAAATRGIVRGENVTGRAGGVDPYFGLIEMLVKDDSVIDQASADFAARNLVAYGSPPPLFVDLPQGSELSPQAPVCINQLVPGVQVPVYLDCLCRPTSATMRLVGVDVTWNASGEHVRTTFAPLASEVEVGVG